MNYIQFLIDPFATPFLLLTSLGVIPVLVLFYLDTRHSKKEEGISKPPECASSIYDGPYVEVRAFIVGRIVAKILLESKALEASRSMPGCLDDNLTRKEQEWLLRRKIALEKAKKVGLL
ncbi:hypothetical protein [Algicola sagamiensis]|uniref:hypothetical protein n=1 Tax=Algicola sagamiensis TaxID=163869 RepID=UPI000375B4B6|nr:hypothetical protein [Algicola sagamiensis]